MGPYNPTVERIVHKMNENEIEMKYAVPDPAQDLEKAENADFEQAMERAKEMHELNDAYQNELVEALRAQVREMANQFLGRMNEEDRNAPDPELPADVALENVEPQEGQQMEGIIQNVHPAGHEFVVEANPADLGVANIEEQKPASVWDQPLTFRSLQLYLKRIANIDCPVRVFDMQTGRHFRLYAVDFPGDAIDPEQEFYTLFLEPVEVGPTPF